MQKRTFTKWVNSHLERGTPPGRVDDLFLDLRDGRLLLRLLAVLSGEMLVRGAHLSVSRRQTASNVAILVQRTCACTCTERTLRPA